MICHRRKLYFVTVVCLVALTSIVTLSYLWVQKSSLLPKIIRQKASVCSGGIVNTSITALTDNRTFIIAPYFDNRERKMTRVIGIVHHKEVRQLYCWYCCQPDGEIYVSRALINVHSDRFGFPYVTADLLCLEPISCHPRYMSIDWSDKGAIGQLPRFEIQNRKADISPVEFTVCISTMFGEYNNVLQFIQSMEMYKILGVQRVMIYKNRCSKLMEKVLAFYIAEGIVEIIPWPITSYLKVSLMWHYTDDGTDICYYGQIVALNDCIYRNMYRSKYVLLNDIDEIILPSKNPDWKSMMSSLEKQNPQVGIFLFENHIFPKTVFTSTGPFNISSWRSVPGVNILQHVHREPDRKEIVNPWKMIVDPKMVIQTSVHSVLEAYGESVKVPLDVALVYHCRVPLQAKLPKEFLIQDTTLWTFSKSLIRNVNKVLPKIL
uniref:Glycosyltransferase family 92 protein n=1 Tax=Sphenodon punctatus TaxID=8508 RepID=A0A8D0HSE8_SPHPU